MSLLKPYQGPIGRAPIGVLPTLPSETVSPSLWATWQAAMSTENIAGSFLDKVAWGVPVFQQPDKNYDPWKEIKGTKYENRFTAFRRANSRDDVFAIMASIDREEKYRKDLANSGIAGIASVFIAGAIMDPTNLIPMGGAFKAVGKIARIGYRLPASVLLGAAVGAGSNALQEVGLQRTQFTRAADESRMAIDAGMFLGGILGAAGGMLPHKEYHTNMIFADFEGNPSFSLKPEFLWEMRNHPDYRYSRAQFRSDLIEDWGLPVQEADAALAYFDATVVKKWTDRTGLSADDFYAENVDQVITFYDQQLRRGIGENAGKPIYQFETITKQPARQPYPWAFMTQNWEEKTIVKGFGEPAGRTGVDPISKQFLGDKEIVDFAGAMAMVPNGKAIIAGLHGAADLGTLLHEMAHIQRRLMTTDELSAWKDYYQNKLGLSNVEAEEAWVKDVENSFKESEWGKNLPEPVKQSALSFRDMLVNIWGKVKDSETVRQVSPQIQQILNKYWRIEKEKQGTAAAKEKEKVTFQSWLFSKLGNGKYRKSIYAGKGTAVADLIGGDVIRDAYGDKKVTGINKLTRNYPHAAFLFTDVRKEGSVDFDNLVSDLRNEFPGLLPADEVQAYQQVFDWLISKDRQSIRMDGGRLSEELDARLADETVNDLQTILPEQYNEFKESGKDFNAWLDSLDEPAKDTLWEKINAEYDERFKQSLKDDVNRRIQERWGEKGVSTLEELESWLESQQVDDERAGIILADYFEPELAREEYWVKDETGKVLFQKLDLEEYARKKYQRLANPERTEMGLEPTPWVPEFVQKFLTRIGPGSRLFSTKFSDKAPILAEKLLHLSAYLGKHWEGRTGDLPPVEIRVFKKVNSIFSEAKKAWSDDFVKYRARIAGQDVPDEATLNAIMKYKIGDWFKEKTGHKTDALDYLQFKRLVWEAWGGKDTGIPEVQHSGGVIQKIMTDLRKELVDAHLLDSEKTKEGHRPRQYLPMAIERYGGAFRRLIQKQIDLGNVSPEAKDLTTLVNDMIDTYTGHLWYEVTPEKEVEELIKKRKQLRLERDALQGADDYKTNKESQKRVKKIMEDLAKIDEERAKFLRHRALTFDDAELINQSIEMQDGTFKNVDFIETDPERVLESYLRTVVPDLELKKQFGSIDLLEEIEGILEDYETKIKDFKGDTKKIEKEKRDVLRDLVIVRDRIRGTDNRPGDPRDPIRRFTNALVKLNSTIYLGNVLLASLADPGRVVMRYGMQPFAKHLSIIFSNKELWKDFKGWERTIGAGTDVLTAMNQRYFELADSREHLRGDSWFERKIETLFENFGLVSGLEPWTSFGKQFTGLVSSHFVLDRARKIANAVKEGKARLLDDGTVKGTVAVSKKDIQQLAQMGLNSQNLIDVVSEFDRFGDAKNPDLLLPRTELWDNKAIKEKFESAIIQEMNNVIITPTIGDRPRSASTPWGQVILQFKSFGMAAQQKMILAGLQQRDSKILSGLLASLFFGGLGYGAKQMVRGNTIERDPDALLVEAIDNSGVLGMFADINGITEIVSRGRLGLHPMVSQGTMSRFTNRDILDVIAGPSGSTMKNFASVLGGAVTFDVNDQTLYALQKITPYSQMWYWRRIGDKLRETASEVVQ